MDPASMWLHWARRLQAIAQSGLAYTEGAYDRERYEDLATLAAEITAHHTKSDPQPIVDGFLAQVGYGTPKVDVRAAVVQENHVLLVQEASDQRWALPGGWADVGDSAVEMAVREAREEAGVEIAVDRLIGVWSALSDRENVDFYHCYKLIFLCRLVSGTPRAVSPHETLDARFFLLDTLPELSLGRTHPAHLQRLRQALTDPDLPPYFE